MEEYNYNQTQTLQPDNGNPTAGNSSGLATASLVLGICSLVLICCGGGVVLGGVGIILALLSRGSGTMNGSAKAGLGLSIGGLAISLIIFLYYFVAMIHSGELNSIIRSYDNGNYFNDYYDRYYDSYNSDDPLNDLLDRYYNDDNYGTDNEDTIL